MSYASDPSGANAPNRTIRRLGTVCALAATAILGLAFSSLAAGQGAHARTVSAKSARSKSAEVPSAPLKSYGSSSAPITMEVFSDYECPSCRSLYETTLRPMINDYVASGKVYLVHRDFPLPMHKYGYEAARWVNAAARVGQFQNVEAALYDNQDAWAADGNIEKYIASAMPAAEFKRVQKLMTGCEYQPPGATGQSCALDNYINADRELGMKIPVQATPTYVITYKGQKLPAGSGAVSWPILKQFFDSLLSQ
ncbi:MAG TPA: thioredoxin domain-containing protein [Candidatus Acidoferrales bacterium]|nr:thioredoxin domain-containing protein [Candidatus Acidoferrales bacterium]